MTLRIGLTEIYWSGQL